MESVFKCSIKRLCSTMIFGMTPHQLTCSCCWFTSCNFSASCFSFVSSSNKTVSFSPWESLNIQVVHRGIILNMIIIPYTFPAHVKSQAQYITTLGNIHREGYPYSRKLNAEQWCRVHSYIHYYVFTLQYATANTDNQLSDDIQISKVSQEITKHIRSRTVWFFNIFWQSATSTVY